MTQVSVAPSGHAAQAITIWIDGNTLAYGQSLTNVPYRQGETTASLLVELPPDMPGAAYWRYSTNNGATWTTITMVNGRLVVPVGGTLLLQYRIGTTVLWQGTIGWDMIVPSPRQAAITSFTISNSGYDFSTARSPFGFHALTGAGGMGSLKLKKSAITGTYKLRIAIAVDPASGFTPGDYTYRVLSGFNLPGEFPRNPSSGGAQSAPEPFSPIPDGTETLPMPVLQNPFPPGGVQDVELTPQDHGDGPYVIQIIETTPGGGPTDTPPGESSAKVLYENTAEGYTSCASCSSCVTPQVSLQDTPVTLSVGGSDGYDTPTGGDPENPDPKQQSCDADGELAFNIPSLFDPSASEVMNPGVAGVSLMAPALAYDLSSNTATDPATNNPVEYLAEVVGERRYVIEPIASSTDPAAFRIVGYSDPNNSGSQFLTVTFEKVVEAGVPTLKITEAYDTGTGVSTKVHRYSKQTSGNTKTAVLKSHNGAREIRRAITPAGAGQPHLWTERRDVREAPSTGGAPVKVLDESLSIRRYSSGVSRVEERVIDPAGRQLRTVSSFYEANQDTGVPGVASSTMGAGRLKQAMGPGGAEVSARFTSSTQEIKTPFGDDPQGTTTRTEISKDPLPDAGFALGTAAGMAGPGSKIQIFKGTVANSGNGESMLISHGQQWGGSAVIMGDGGGATGRFYHPSGHSVAPGRITRILERSGRLTTIAYAYENGEKLIIEETGEPDATAMEVVKGERTVTTSTACRRMLSEEVFGFNNPSEKADPQFLSGRYAGPADFDPLGRSLAVHYNTYPSEDRDTYTYGCCGVASHTDRRGKIIEYVYDNLGRVQVTRVKRSSGGPQTVFATTRTGLKITERRNGVVMSETVRNLAGELITSKTADENGDGVPESTTHNTIYTASGRQAEEIGPLGVTSYRSYYLDGRLKARWGSAVADRFYQYLTGADAAPYAMVSKEYKLSVPYQAATLDLTTEMEYDAVGYDSEGRRVAFWNAASSAQPAVSEYDEVTGLLERSVDPDGVETTYHYHADGTLHHSVVDISDNRVVVSSREYGFSADTLVGASVSGSRWEKRFVQSAVGPTTGLAPVSTRWMRGDGYAMKSISAAAGEGLAFESLPTLANRTAGSWTSTEVSPDGTKSVEQYADGLLVTSQYLDNADNVVSSTGYTFDPIGRVLTSTDSRTGTTSYDENGDGVPEMTASGNIRYVREPSVAGSEVRVTRFIYDLLGRTTQTILPDGSSSYTSFYPTSQVRSVWGSQTYPQHYTHDEQGRLKGLRTWRNNPPAGNPTVTNGSDLTTWEYDFAGRLYKKIDSLGRDTQYDYSQSGRLRFRYWAREASAGGPRLTTEYRYDKGLLEEVLYNDASTQPVTYTHDEFGRIQGVNQGGNSWRFRYDPVTWQLRDEQVTYDLDADGTPELSRLIKRGWDTPAGGRPASIEFGVPVAPVAPETMPDTLAVSEQMLDYGFDGAGRMDSLNHPLIGAAPGRDQSFEYTYFPGSAALLDVIHAPAHDVVHEWEQTRDVLSAIDNRASNGTTLAKTSYLVNRIGQRTSMAETGLHVTGVPSREWVYNTRGELVSEDGPGTSFDRGYRYDGIGNRVRTAVNTTNTTTATGADLGTYFASSGGAAGANPVNQYGQVALPGQAPVAVVHDLDGNMTSGPLPTAPGSVSHFSWDAENRLTQVAVGGGGGTVSYRYDPFGRRIARILGNITELTLYDGWNPVAEYANTPQSTTISLKRTFVWGLDVSGSLQGAGGVGGLLAIREAAGNGSSKAGQAIFPAYDGNGNIIRLTDSNGATVASYAYDGFGNRINPAASDIDGSGYANENRYGFSTKPRDPLTGLLYYGYRWYDPATGRWASRDPLGEDGGKNLYGLLRNRSINSVDVLGRNPFLNIKELGIGASVSAQIGLIGYKLTVTQSINQNCEICVAFTITYQLGLGAMVAAEIVPQMVTGPSAEGTGYSESNGGNISGGKGPVVGIGTEESDNGNTNLNGSGIGVGFGGQVVATHSRQCKACVKPTWWNAPFIQIIAWAEAVAECLKHSDKMVEWPSTDDFTR
jgi:RHS repeat-associated protein